ncbi:MAG: FAD-dependent thymidylate synthase [bacterium]
MKVELLKYTPNPEILVAMAAKLCYSESTIDDLWKEMKKKEVSDFINKLMVMGHHSPFEHISFTFGIEGISRVTTHQLVRHRIASYSQQSQRYVKYNELKYITPHTIQKNKDIERLFIKVMETAKNAYKQLLKSGIPAEDARYVFPEACETKIIVTMNARELLHFFRLRCCNRAQWEIRRMAYKMLNEVLKVAPVLFSDAGPGCWRGPCPENKMSCGKPPKREEVLDDIKQRKGDNKK